MTTASAPERTDLLVELEQEVGVLIRRVRRVIGERARAVHPDLQASTYLMLTWLEQHGPVRPSAMAEAFCVDKGAISRQVHHLGELGLVERIPDPEDGRAQLVSASAMAVQRLNEIIEQRRTWLSDRLADLGEDDLREFVRLLGRYNASLDRV